MSRYGPEVREAAFGLYCDGLTDVAIAKRLGMPRLATIDHWKAKYKWVARRHEILQGAVAAVDKDRVTKVVKRLVEHDDAGKGLRGGIIGVLNVELAKVRRVIKAQEAGATPEEIELMPLPAPLTLQRLGQALRSAIYVERQALGLGDKEEDESGVEDEVSRLSMKELEETYAKVRELTNGKDKNGGKNKD
jgi:hypothetical protein